MDSITFDVDVVDPVLFGHKANAVTVKVNRVQETIVLNSRWTDEFCIQLSLGSILPHQKHCGFICHHLVRELENKNKKLRDELI
jgi:hypothetical protein